MDLQYQICTLQTKAVRLGRSISQVWRPCHPSRCWAHEPAIHAASQVDNEKEFNDFLFFYACMWFYSYSYGAPIGGPSYHRSSSIRFYHAEKWTDELECVMM